MRVCVCPSSPFLVRLQQDTSVCMQGISYTPFSIVIMAQILIATGQNILWKSQRDNSRRDCWWWWCCCDCAVLASLTTDSERESKPYKSTCRSLYVCLEMRLIECRSPVLSFQHFVGQQLNESVPQLGWLRPSRGYICLHIVRPSFQFINQLKQDGWVFWSRVVWHGYELLLS